MFWFCSCSTHFSTTAEVRGKICTGVKCNMDYENALTCTAVTQTLHHLLCTLHQISNLHKITTFGIHSSSCKITTATLINLHKNPPHCPNQLSPLGRNMYGVIKTTICNIISKLSYYQSTSSSQKEINTYITIC